ncbi:MAG TPA: glycosyltransferase [Intrasporangium sp.]|uniref:glycosyltransferase n=1 Tax=Intrasporangium sp. TaxID=1925024 RepID=UPI002D797D18|nr:glycosyltransferase [Intrasporangium sp.]HET7397812.1 glycosyltransferase [Intrasporangium sp.]
MQQVGIDAIPLDRLATILDAERATSLRAAAARAAHLLAGRTVWNVSSTASGGGVAEMLQALLSYTRGAGVDTRWLVLDATPEFFRLTKQLHNLLHGSGSGDAPPLEDGLQVYAQVSEDNLRSLAGCVRAGDVVILHDPQTAGLVAGLRRLGAHVVWRCHVGRDDTNAQSAAAWGFLRPHVEQADALIFSRQQFVPGWVDPARVWLIPPSLDPFSAKNRFLPPADVAATLRRWDLVGLAPGHAHVDFVRRDGTLGSVRRHHDVVVGGPVPGEARMVLQVSRWDRLKDMAGVLTAFATHLPGLPDDVHLLLAGPDGSGVSDDPEGAEVVQECLDLWRSQPEAARRRLHLCSLPMDDIDENAHVVNALQRHAAVVVQKSLEEGFGLTVTEPMWKGRPVVASAVGGIQDQVVHGESGLLLDDPRDLDAFAGLLQRLLDDPPLAHQLGEHAHERVRARFLGDRHLIQYADLVASLLG